MSSDMRSSFPSPVPSRSDRRTTWQCSRAPHANNNYLHSKLLFLLIISINSALLVFVSYSLWQTSQSRPLLPRELAFCVLLGLALMGYVLFFVLDASRTLTKLAGALSGGAWIACCFVSGNSSLLPGVLAVSHYVVPYYYMLPFSLGGIAFSFTLQPLLGELPAIFLSLIIVLAFFVVPLQPWRNHPTIVPRFDEISEAAKSEVALARLAVEERRPGALGRIDSSLVNFSALRIHEKLGAGAFGDVFRATLGEEHTVAVKLVQAHRVNKETVGALLTEVDVMKQCAHPNIVTVVGLVTHPVVCLVLEYMPGGSLQHYLSMAHTPNQWSHPKTRMAVDIAAGISYLHARGIVHGDLKSENLLVAEGGIVKLADFGSAVALNQEKGPMQILGSSMWLAPEVARGNAMTEKSDVWSFGVCLCEMLTHLPPYTNKNGECYFRLLDVAQMKLSPMTAVAALENVIPKDVLQVMEMACAFQAQDRADMKILLFALLQVFVSGPDSSLPAASSTLVHAAPTPGKATGRRPLSQQQMSTLSSFDSPPPNATSTKRISDPTTSARRRGIISRENSPGNLV